MLVVKETKRIEYPAEPGTWFAVRVPLSAGDLAGLRSNGQNIGMSLDLVTSVLKDWSYEAPITPENVDALDIDTFVWLTKQITEASGIRSEGEE